MGEDLERYKAEKGVKEEHLIDRESRSHQVSDCWSRLRHCLMLLEPSKTPYKPETPSSASWSASLCLQKAFFAGVKLYDKGNYKESAMLFEEALTKYYRADVECRALCEGPQHFEEQSHVLYKYNLYELISGTHAFVLRAFFFASS